LSGLFYYPKYETGEQNMAKMMLVDIKDSGAKREHGEIEGLKQSINEIGLINPITVDANGKLLAGRRRFQAVSELGWNEVEVRVLPVDKPLTDFRVALDENLKRKQLTDPEVAVAIQEYDELKRNLEGEREAGGDRQSIGYSVTDDKGWSLQKTADELGVSKPAVVKAIKIAEAVKKHPKLAKLKSGQAILTEQKRIEVVEVKPPAEQYRTIVIDPPWPVEKIARESRPNQYDFDYPTMTVDAIKALTLPACPDGCHVYLWTTQKHLPVAFEIFKAWGVKYECVLTWVKNVGFTPFSFMYSTEHCLFGRIGNLPLMKLGKRLDFTGKVREHSRKPDEFYELVREVSPEPRIDIFSREKHEGYEQYGNETAKFAVR
jgi:N6-adenosine-specific RNA methylase IME4